MIVYLEGPDGSGKTTLADKILNYCNSNGIQCIRHGQSLVQTKPNMPTRMDATTIIKNINMMLESDILYILDRGPISDCIYRIFDYDECVISFSKQLEIMLQTTRLFFIYCRTENAEKYMLERGDDNPVAIARHKEIVKAYDTLIPVIENFALVNRYVEYDFEHDSEKEIFVRIHDFISYQKFLKA